MFVCVRVCDTVCVHAVMLTLIQASGVVSGVESQVQSEFALLHDQLSGVEQYAMRYLETERVHISQELRLAEVGKTYSPSLLSTSPIVSVSLFLLSPLSLSSSTYASHRLRKL